MATMRPAPPPKRGAARRPSHLGVAADAASRSHPATPDSDSTTEVTPAPSPGPAEVGRVLATWAGCRSDEAVDQRSAAQSSALLLWWDTHSSAAPGALTLHSLVNPRATNLRQWWRALERRLTVAAVRSVLRAHVQGKDPPPGLLFISQADCLARGVASKVTAADLTPAGSIDLVAEQLRLLAAGAVSPDIRSAARRVVGADPTAESLPCIFAFESVRGSDADLECGEDEVAEPAVTIDLTAAMPQTPLLLVARRVCTLLGLDAALGASPGCLHLRLGSAKRKHCAAGASAAASAAEAYISKLS